jgi:hypothetical protein
LLRVHDASACRGFLVLEAPTCRLASCARARRPGAVRVASGDVDVFVARLRLANGNDGIFVPADVIFRNGFD